MLIQVFSVLFRISGLTKVKAKFQVISLLTNSGFTTSESEIVVSAACIGIAHFIKWLFSFQWWIYLIAGLILIGIVVLVYYLKHKHAKKKSLANEQIINTEQINNPVEETT